jgi:RNA polymerase sigma-70 factor (ECF subfamily)
VFRRGPRLLTGNKPVAKPQTANGLGSSQIEQWLEQARGGSSAALGSLLEGCRKYLLMMANGALDSDLRPKAAASDLVQDSFVEVHRDFDQFRGTTEEELFAWLTGILSHRLANNVRRHRHTQKRSVNREVPLETVPREAIVGACDDPSPSGVAIARDEERRVQAAFDRLAEPLRTVLILRTWERQSFAEIGVELTRSAESARKLWSRAVRQLEKELRHIQ